MNVLITGGAGFIGRRLAERLAADGIGVRVLDLRAPHDAMVSFHPGDVRDPEAVGRAVAGTNAVFHLAAEHRDDVRPVERYQEVNVRGTANLLEAMTRAGCHRIVFTSTVAVYPLNVHEPDEEHPPAPFNDYGRSKLEAERLVEAWAAGDPNRCAVIVRLCVVFGEGNRGNVYNLLHQIASGRFVMVGRGGNRKSMAYVGNVAAFLRWCLDLPPGLHRFNYADKPDLTTAELVGLARRALGRDGHWTARLRLPYPIGLGLGYVADGLARLTGRSLPWSSIRVKKFCAETTVNTARLERTGFVRPFTLQEGLRRMIEHEFLSAGSSAGQAPGADR
ncbi:NAD-dependent epimerase/dehydratase family protein [Limisphaera ngatamarikiensis]|uniref:NAD-dependent epimerase/dehydratase family protein n=1 Tax=Limisphaera ngatamarikiensis TaxID=1324935 RepID=A0A6M1RU56_9BACT|nr:NAD-dependent epimerase/dehydratase family protein [Limisphaera ngatamarikiensis]NGO40175.1 NAD-dependent epimerase/dehydratase family protein [Limisphaera ngatamarikiensis]